MSRIIQQTPAELKKMADEGFANAMKKAIKDKTIDLTKIPQSQRLWWKQFLVEPAVALGTGVGGAKVVAKKEQEKVEKKIESTIIGDKPVEYSDEQIENSLNKVTTTNEIDDD